MEEPEIRFTDWVHSNETATPLFARLADERLARVLWQPVSPMLFVAAILCWPTHAASSASHGYWFLLSIGINVLGAIFVQLHCLMFRKRLLQSLQGQMDLPSPMPQFAVEVIYTGKKAHYGRDLGILTFHPGLIDFNGRNSHFAIPVQDRPGFKYLKSLGDNSLTCQIQLEGYRVRIALEHFSSLTQSPAYTFPIELKEARRAKAPQSPVYLLPPASPNFEEVQSQSWMMKSALVAAILWAPLIWLASGRLPHITEAGRLGLTALVSAVYLVLAGVYWRRLAVTKALKKAKTPSSEPVAVETPVCVAADPQTTQVTG